MSHSGPNGPSVPQYGFIEGWSQEAVTGWASDPANPVNPATVALLVDNVPAVTAVAAEVREDVAQAGFAHAKCGFCLPLGTVPRLVRESYSPERPPPVVLLPSRTPLDIVPSLRSSVRPCPLPPAVAASVTFAGSILVQGPLVGDYSIAIVNRELTKALIPSCASVTCSSDEANIAGDALFQAEAALTVRFDAEAQSSNFDVHTFFSWPPDVGHMKAGLNALHCYCWEESEFPPGFVAQFNAQLQLITTMSDYTRRVLENAGVTVPIVTIGSGIDHLLNILSAPVERLATRRFRFLHVSSCFPRKGADVLLRAYADEFAADEPVELLIKTFDNVHNDMEAQIAARQVAQPGMAAVTLCKDQFDPAQMRWLYESSQCVVLPTRGEGFLLPAAEAMLLGVPVVTTAHSGQTDFCTGQTAWLVDVSLAPSRSHMNLAHSLWAEPDVASLRRRMREVYEATQAELYPRLAAARALMTSRYRWSDVAGRFISALDARRTELSQLAGPTKPQRLGVVSTWNQRCGIATYARQIVDHAPASIDVTVLAEDCPEHGADEAFVQRIWLRSDKGYGYLADMVGRSTLDSVLIQHHPGLMSWQTLGWLIELTHAAGKRAFVELHSTREGQAELTAIAPALLRCAGIFVHTADDVLRLDVLALQARVVVVPHGVADGSDAPARPVSLQGFHVGAFGFLMPHKGVAEHLEALHLLRRRVPDLRATLLHSLTEDAKTIEYAAYCFELRERLGLVDVVDIQTQFLPMAVVRQRLAACDVAVFPYKESSESASGAIRSLTGLDLPMVCSPATIFDDIRDICHTAAGTAPVDLAAALYRMATDHAERDRLVAAQARHVQHYAWPNVMRRIFTVIDRTVPCQDTTPSSLLVLDAAA